MQFALMIYHTTEEFDMRKNDYSDPHLGAWRAYYKALVEAGVYVGANALEVPETGTTVRLKEGGALQHPDERVTPLTLDVTNGSQIQRAVDEVDTLDVLINSAGIAIYDDLSNLD